MKIIPLTIGLLLILSCGQSGDRDLASTEGLNPEEQLRFSNARDVMQARCERCHSTFVTYSQKEWVTSGLVKQGSPETSRLLLKIRGSGYGGEENMPPSLGTSLEPEEIEVLRVWVRGIVTHATAHDAAGRLSAALLVVQSSCASCHGVPVTATSAPFAGVLIPAFAKFKTENEFATAGLINPGSPETSLLYRALKGYGDIGTMPSGGAALEPERQELLKNWIAKIGEP